MRSCALERALDVVLTGLRNSELFGQTIDAPDNRHEGLELRQLLLGARTQFSSHGNKLPCRPPVAQCPGTAFFPQFNSGGTVSRILWYAPAAIWAAVVLFIGGLSHVPSVHTTLPVDKVAHFFMYGVLGLLATLGWLKAQRPHRLLWVLLIAMAIGAGDEIHQRWVPSRSSDFKDWIADAVGVAVAATLVLKLKKERPNHVV